jgi:CheY-like chemotaxis protein
MESQDPIVLVDDDADHRWILCVLLEHLGHVGLPLDGGRALFDYLRRGGRVGLVVLDLNMPEMPGDEVHARLKRNPAYATIPIVVLSGVAEFRTLPGVAAHIRKGGDPEVLVRMIDRIYREAD